MPESSRWRALCLLQQQLKLCLTAPHHLFLILQGPSSRSRTHLPSARLSSQNTNPDEVLLQPPASKRGWGNKNKRQPSFLTFRIS